MVLALRRSFSGPDVVAQAVEALSGKGPVSRCGASGWIVSSGSIGCAARYLSACANSWPASRLFRIKHRSSDRRWWPRSVATTLISGSPPTRNSYCGPRWYASRSRFGVCCASSTPRASARTGNQARSSVICAAWATFIAATRSGKANITCLPTRPGVLRLQQSILGKRLHANVEID